MKEEKIVRLKELIEKANYYCDMYYSRVMYGIYSSRNYLKYACHVRSNLDLS